MTGAEPASHAAPAVPAPFDGERHVVSVEENQQKILGDVPADTPWARVAQLPTGQWTSGMVKGAAISPPAARHVYLRMRPPRSITRLQHGLKFLGFEMGLVNKAELREWSRNQMWADEAIAYDLGVISLSELKHRIASTRRSILLPAMEALSETLSLALDPETMEEAIRNAAKQGNFKQMVEGVEKLISQMAALAGDPVPIAQVHQHQHVHAHVAPGANGASPAIGVRATLPQTAAERVLAQLDRAAEGKRLTPPINAQAKEIADDNAAERPASREARVPGRQPAPGAAPAAQGTAPGPSAARP